MTPEQSEQKARANETLARIDFLLANEHFLWFMATVIEVRRDKEARAGLDVGKSSEDRSNSAHRHDALNEVATWLPAQKATLEMTIKTLDY